MLSNIFRIPISTIGPGIGSFEGYIFTNVAISDHLKAYIETFLYVSLFIGILFLAQKFAHKKIVTIASIVLVLLIGFIGVSGYLNALYMLSQLV